MLENIVPSAARLGDSRSLFTKFKIKINTAKYRINGVTN